jgi:hypothetical protein
LGLLLTIFDAKTCQTRNHHLSGDAKMPVMYNGKEITLDANMSGMQTGFARIGNPYWDGDEHWRIKDGDTVIGCEADDPRAMPVEEAYQIFFDRMAEEDALWAEEMARWEEEDAEYYRKKQQEQEDADPMSTDRLYEVQDRLSGR